MASHIHHRVDGTPYKIEFQTGRRKSPDPKENVSVRLPKSWRLKIKAETTEQKFIEEAVFNEMVRRGMLDGCCNTETV